jgi:hypothetical protein
MLSLCLNQGFLVVSQKPTSKCLMEKSGRGGHYNIQVSSLVKMGTRN